MSINKKILNIFLITVFTVFVLAEGLFLILLPSWISNEKFLTFVEEKTNLSITFDHFKIKNYPNFSTKIILKNLAVSDSEKEIATIQNANLLIKPLSIILNKIDIKSLYAENTEIYIRKEIDNNIYIGKISMHKLQKILENYNIFINNVHSQNTKIKFNDLTTKQIFLTDISNADFNYKKNNYIQINIESKTTAQNIKPIETYIKISSKLPFDKGMANKDFLCKGYVKNLNIKILQPYIEKWYKKTVLSSDGIINIEFNSTDFLNIKTSINNFKIQCQNNIDSIHYIEPINIIGQIKFDKQKLLLNNIKTTAKDWDIKLQGSVNNFKNKDLKKIEPNINIDIINSNIAPIYKLIPSTPKGENKIIQKLKNENIQGILNGQIKLSNNLYMPQIDGQANIENIVIFKKHHNTPTGKANIEFIKDKVKLNLRIFTSKNEYADIDGIAELKPNGSGEFFAKSTPNVDLTIAQDILLVAQNILQFKLGPVPFMKLKGNCEFNMDIKGTIEDSTINGKFLFKNATATIDGLNTILSKGNGAVIFKQKDISFYTNNVQINNNNIEIKGKANHNGDIDFNIISNKIKIEELFKILNTSEILKNQKVLASPIENISGHTKINVNAKGTIKDFSTLKTNNPLNISGILTLQNVYSKLKDILVPISGLNGQIKFDNNGWSIDTNGICTKTSKIYAKGYANEKSVNIKFNGQNIKIAELGHVLAQNKDFGFLKELPQTNSIIEFNAEYKTPFGLRDKNISLENLIAKGKIYSLPNIKNDFDITNGIFLLNNNTLILKNFDAKLLNSKIFANAKIEKIFSPKPIINGVISTNDFDLHTLNSINSIHFVPESIKNILNIYENYEGKADAIINCKNNYLDGWINLKNIKFQHKHFNTPITIDSGKIILDGPKILLKSIIAQIDTIPTFLNLSIYDLDKTMKINGYMTTKFNEYFANKYINQHLSYPIKPKGDITITTNITGTPDSMTIQPKIKLAEGADIYYMGANFGDEQNKREILADINIIENTYNIKKLNYIRYMISQNEKIYPLTIIDAKGTIEQIVKDKTFYIKNLNIETLNNANAKIFNILFKKSILKNGMFNCKLNIKGAIENPKITGKTTLENIDMPLYNTFVKNLAINFGEKTINTSANIQAYNSDIKLTAIIKNTLQKPYILENLEIKSDKLNLDTLIDAITAIPTPNTTTKLIEHSQTNSLPINIADVQISNGSFEAKDIIIKDVPAKDYKSTFALGNNLVLNIPNLEFDISTGKISGSANYDFEKDKIKANLKAINVDANQIATSLLGFENQIFGKAKGNISITTKGNSQDERIKNMTGHIYFEITDGKMPKLGSVEYLLKAGNFIKSGITGASINNLIELLNPIKTGSFDSIKGKLSLKNGVAQDIEIYSKGENLNMFINGEYDILQKYANMRVFGRLTRKASGILGPVGNISFNSILNSIPGIKLSNKDKDSIINDINKIPSVELSEKEYRIFTVKIDGEMNDDNKFVKNFRWLE